MTQRVEQEHGIAQAQQSNWHKRTHTHTHSNFVLFLNKADSEHHQLAYEIPSKFALFEYVLGYASDVGCCMKPAKTIGDSQKNDLCMLARFVVWA